MERIGKEFDADEHMKQVLDYLDNYIESNGMPIKKGLIELLQYAKNNNIKIAIGTSEKFQAAYRSGAKPIMIIDRIEPTDEIKDLLFVKPLDSLT